VSQSRPQRFGSTRKFIAEYRRSRLGLAGIIIILFFLAVALLAPILAQHDPINDQNLASPLSIPIWARSFPQYASTPITAQLLSGSAMLTQSDMTHWQLVSRPSANDQSNGSVAFSNTQNGLLLEFKQPSSTGNPFATPVFPSIAINQTFSYPWSFPCRFHASFQMTPISQSLSTSQLTVDMYLTSVGGKTYQVLGPAVYADASDTQEYYSEFAANKTYTMSVNPNNPYVSLVATGSTAVLNLGPCGLSQGIFSHPGNVTVSLVLTSTVATKVLVANAGVVIIGSAYGVLGTDSLGRDIFSQFVYGARVSLGVGLFAALIAVVIGTVVGLVAGFAGGFTDELLMRFNDFLLILPFLPLILVVLTILTVSGAAKSVNTELLILLFIGLLGWNGIARIIRAQVLTIKQRQFVEASRALGAKDRHIIWKHILPNVMGLVYANIALTVPSAILTEAALTFLGFGDPSTISWGTMLSNAQAAFTSSLHSFVWWWFFPPGIAIAAISMAFIFVGFSLDSILNPRLRQR
jgi:peptide/nickel transport system permease protein